MHLRHLGVRGFGFIDRLRDKRRTTEKIPRFGLRVDVTPQILARESVLHLGSPSNIIFRTEQLGNVIMLPHDDNVAGDI